MIELERHIEILLLKNDCVIVPCLGGFIASHIPAKYDERDNLFLPPLRTLGFNPKLNINDSLLVQSYAEAYDISYPDAYTRIESEVNELKQHIYNDGFYELSDIGTLYLNDNGNLEFKPCEAGILTPDLYSLSSFEMKKYIAEDSAEQDILADENYTLGKSTATITYATSPISKKQKTKGTKSVPDFSNEGNMLNVKIRVLKSIFAVIVAIITFFAWTSPINNTNKMIQMSNMDNGIIHNLLKNSYNNVTHESIKLRKSNKANINDTHTNKSLTHKNQSDIADISNSNNNYFCIVLASRVTQKNADAFVNKLQASGINAITIAERNNSRKVVYGKFKTKNEAYNALNDLKGNEHFYDAWVYHYKLTE